MGGGAAPGKACAATGARSERCRRIGEQMPYVLYLLRIRRDLAGLRNDAFGVTVRSVPNSQTCPHDRQTQLNTTRPR